MAWLDAPSQTGSRSCSGRVAMVVGRSTGKNSPSKVKSRHRQRQVHHLKALEPGAPQVVVAQVPAGRDLGLARDTAAEAELEPAAAEQVERAGLFRHPDRVVQRQHGHRGAEPDPAGLHRGGGQQQVRRRAGHQRGVVLGDGDPVEAEFLGEHRELHEVLHLALLPARVVDIGARVARVQAGAVGVHELECSGLVAERGHELQPPMRART